MTGAQGIELGTHQIRIPLQSLDLVIHLRKIEQDSVDSSPVSGGRTLVGKTFEHYRVRHHHHHLPLMRRHTDASCDFAYGFVQFIECTSLIEPV